MANFGNIFRPQNILTNTIQILGVVEKNRFGRRASNSENFKNHIRKFISAVDHQESLYLVCAPAEQRCTD